MNSIWKYNISAGYDSLGVEMPKGAKILTVQTQDDIPMLWAIVDPSAPKEVRTIRIVGTGWGFDEERREYIGTYQLYNGALVFHVFEELG